MQINPQTVTFNFKDIQEMVDWFLDKNGLKMLSITANESLIKNAIVVEVEEKSGE